MQKASSSEAQLSIQYLPDLLECCEYNFVRPFKVHWKSVVPYLHRVLQGLKVGRMQTLNYCTLNRLSG